MGETARLEQVSLPENDSSGEAAGPFNEMSLRDDVSPCLEQSSWPFRCLQKESSLHSRCLQKETTKVRTAFLNLLCSPCFLLQTTY
jgi:hypothetical protein